MTSGNQPPRRAPFRHDVHALRALASVFVLVFHVNPDLLPGGFAGVDIFYVISGFVIFRGLFADAAHRSVLAFYRRRFFRIFPNIVATTGLTLFAGFLLMTPDELARLAGSALASLFSVSNFYFADRLGYFAPAVAATPLIHFWSLAVEEQFYLLTPPLLMLFAWCRTTRAIVTAILAIVGLSFAINCLFVYGLNDATKAFYYPFTRFWEIGLGVLLAAIEPHLHLSPLVRRLMIGLAAAGLIAAGFALSAETVFPGLAALLPTLAATLFILAASDALPAATRLSRSRPVAFLGDISYALYIAHWPIIAFWNILRGTEKSWSVEVLLLLLCLVAAIALRQVVELPFIRLGRRQSVARPALGLGGGIAALTVIALLALWTGGFPIRLDADARDLLARIDAAPRHSTSCRGPGIDYVARTSHFALCGADTPPRYLLAGDSHAGMIAPELNGRLAERGFSGLLSTMADCQMLFGTTTAKAKNRANCATLHDDILKVVAREKIDVVILVNRWANIASPVRAPYDGGAPKGLYDAEKGGPISFADALDHTIRAIREAGAEVLLVGPVPELNFDVPSAVLRRAQIGIPVPDAHRADVDLRQSIVRPAMTAVNKAEDVSVVEPDDTLCDASTCAYARDGLPLYEDSNHLNAVGAELVTAPIADAVVKILERRASTVSAPVSP